MERNTTRRSQANDVGLEVCTDWCTGPRTPAWDRLWRAILEELGPELSVGSESTVGRVGDDG